MKFPRILRGMHRALERARAIENSNRRAVSHSNRRSGIGHITQSGELAMIVAVLDEDEDEEVHA